MNKGNNSMTFSAKPTVMNGGGNSASEASPEDWKAWSEYLYESIPIEGTKVGETRTRKEGEMVGKVSFLMELGMIPSKQFYDTKVAAPEGDEKFSEAELAYMEQYKGSSFEWTYDNGKKVRKQTSVRRDPEWVMCVDFPEIMVDYSKFPYNDSDVEDLRPLRVSVNGWFKTTFNRRLNNSLDRNTKALSPKNYFHKLAIASGKLEEFSESGWDLGVLSDAVANFTLRVDRDDRGEQVYVNESIVGAPEAITDVVVKGKVVASKEDQMPENLDSVEFTGILLNGMEYTEDMLKQIRKNWKSELAKGQKWEDGQWVDCFEGTDLAKALGSSSQTQTPPQESKPKTPEKKQTPKQGPVKQDPPEEDFPFEDDIPF